MNEEVEFQRKYYARTAADYDEMHVHGGDEHFLALGLMTGVLDFLGVASILDVGAGTGRTLAHLKALRPGLRVGGVEPVAQLREIAHAKGISRDELVDGDATALPFETATFDLVCEFGMLHHVRAPERAIAEMLRVAKKAVFLSDSNNFGQGSPVARAVKQAIDLVGLWPLADRIKTRGKGYTISEGDGLSYSYSVFTNYRQIRAACASVHVLNTVPGGINPYRTAGHVALLGVLR